MSNQRSFVLFVAFATIVSYLYYESISEVNAKQKTSPPEEKPFYEQLKEKPKVPQGRHLLYYSPEESDYQQVQTSEQVSFRTITHNIRATNKALKTRRKRSQRDTSSQFFNWKFNINVTKLGNEATKSSVNSSESNKDLKIKKTDKEESMSLAVYVEGNGTKQSSELQHAWNSVGEFLKYLFGDTKISVNKQGIGISATGLSNQTIQANDGKKVEGKEKKNSPKNLKSKEGKFLSSLFNFGTNNKENPPIELGSGDTAENVESQTKLMQDIFFATSSDPNNKATDSVEGIIPSALSTEIISKPQELDSINVARISNHLSSTTSQSEFGIATSNTLITDHSTASSSSFKEVPKCNDCTSEFSGNSENVISNTAALSVNEDSADNQVSVTATKSSEVLKSLCMILQKNIRKSPRFIEVSDIGSGSSSIGDNAEDFKVNPTTETTTKEAISLESQNILLRFWNSIRFRNERKILESSTESEISNEVIAEDLDSRFFLSGLLDGFGSGRASEMSDSDFVNATNVILPADFSMRDCMKFFINRESDFTTQKEVVASVENINADVMLVNSTFSLKSLESVSQDNLTSVSDSKMQTNSLIEEPFKTDNITSKPVCFNETSKKPASVQFTDSSAQDQFVTPYYREELNTASRSTFRSTDVIKEEKSVTNFPGLEDTFNSSDESLKRNHFSTVEGSVQDTEQTNIIQEDRRLFIDLNNDAILELGSSDDGRIFGSLLSSGERELKSQDIDQETKISVQIGQERRFFPFNFLNFGSGSKEISDADSTQNIDLSLNTGNQNKSISFGNFNLGSGERSLDEIQITTDSLTSDFIPTINKISQSTLTTLKTSSETMYKEMKVNELVEYTTSSLSLRKGDNSVTRLDSFSSSKKLLQDINTEDSNPRFFEDLANGAGRDHPEEQDLKELNFQSNVNCLNCHRNSNIVPSGCENCKKIKSSTYNFDTANEAEAQNYSPLKKDSKSELCPGCNSNNTEVLTELKDSLTSDDSIKRAELKRGPAIKPNTLLDKNCMNCENTSLDNPNKMTENSLNIKIIPITTSVDVSDKTELDNKETTKVASSNDGFGSLKQTNNLKVSNESRDIQGPRLDDFLTISEVDGLLDNSQIHLAQKPEHSSPSTSSAQSSVSPRRGARAHDFFPPDWPDFTTTSKPKDVPYNTQPTGFTHIAFNEIAKNTETVNITQTQGDGRIKNETKSIFVDDGNTSNSVTTLTDLSKILSIPGSSEIAIKDQTGSIAPSDHSYQDKVPIPFATTENEIKVDVNVNPRTKSSVVKLCRSASECDDSLNERCFSNDDGIPFCTCAKALVRNPENRRCEATITLQTSARLPGEQFHEDLRNRNSELFKKKRIESIETMWMLLENDPELFLTVAEVDVAGFEEGSLVVQYNIKVLTGGNETVSELIEQIDEDLKEVLGSKDSFRKFPLDVHNASAITFAINSCLRSEHNYCDKNAECLLDGKDGFRCRCKDGYLDNPKNTRYPGEVCIAFCVPDYCGQHGECQLKTNGEKHCLCSGWYFGERCEISGIIVIAGFTGANILVIFIVLLLACVFKKRCCNCYNGSVAEFQPGVPSDLARSQRVTDAIALAEVGPSKISKFVNISTPLFEQAPVIQVTSPSFPGSSIDYDSTFDRSRFSENSRNEYDMANKV